MRFYSDEALTQVHPNIFMTNSWMAAGYIAVKKIKQDTFAFAKVYIHGGDNTPQLYTYFKLNYRTCGFETINAASSYHSSFNYTMISSLNVINSTVINSFFTGTSDNTNCPIRYFQLNKNIQGDKIDSEFGSNYMELNVKVIETWGSMRSSNLLAITSQEIVLNNTITHSETFNIYLAAYTLGGFNFQSVPITFNFEYI